MLLVSYYKQFRYDFRVENGKSVTISSQVKSVIPIGNEISDIHISNQDDLLTYTYNGQTKPLTSGSLIEGIRFYVVKEDIKIYTPLDQTSISFGHKKGYDLLFSAQSPNFLITKV
ncbi:cell division protein FtsK [Streptococcus iniae]|uniref:Cell division protein FtsK n=1 Tax=Streptococcus iniae TaxID=1346 RepID=A0A3L8GEB4_STRIN|nr:cell division protein FtsK [Streptococcus iniae]RLU52172.1 cell division protein FtsK [Streptococcus iniae]RLU55281.1 cell division protein FtsK [Streptococcus iniae]